jgi:uncharacterized protein
LANESKGVLYGGGYIRPMIWSGLLIGLVGEVHCLAMCGPIALALPVPANENRIVGITWYSAGRVFTYSLLGLLFGIFGSMAALAGLQQGLSILAGLTLLVMALFSFFGKTFVRYTNPISVVLSKLKNAFGEYLKKKAMASLLVVGLLNGLLPCGLVYIALIGAIAMGDWLLGGLYMFFFGLGTVPLMFLLAYTKNKITISWRQKAVKLVPVFVGMIGLMFVLRGLNLGVPYLSPIMSSLEPEKTSCCHKP